jgi:hypothetical protein
MPLSQADRQRLDSVNEEIEAKRNEAKHAWKKFDDARQAAGAAIDAGKLAEAGSEGELGRLHSRYEQAADEVENLTEAREVLWGRHFSGSSTSHQKTTGEQGSWLASQLHRFPTRRATRSSPICGRSARSARSQRGGREFGAVRAGARRALARARARARARQGIL